ncbi:endonuclease/exonuclease/phosphatase family protein [Psychromonas sp. RZ22]|uniref:endonuclease/exonuclease/phosphatase family protein n=1 Tax=Psychromonas algarum TaxID=2555643 RepID=UPI0010675FAB|nr:endonuclease/exonuclease/phosphatase family protein [Psychromonas sp. RZ22]TEW55699.1 endonuclease/exonuclease/phosphatase family protein [Psychromonas sp. RZ22]
MKTSKILPFLISSLLVGCNSNSSNTDTEEPELPAPAPQPESYQTEVKVLSANMWNSLRRNFTTNDRLSFDIAVEELKFASPDVILLSEASGVTARLGEELGMYVWQGKHDVSSVGLLSKYPIKQVFDNQDIHTDNGNVIGAILDINGRDVPVWSAHLDYQNYVVYDARGGNGFTWSAREGCVAVSDSDELDILNERSMRPDQVRYMLTKLTDNKDNNDLIIFGGDFNEASGLDWTEETAYMFDHAGTQHDFLTHRLVKNAGYTDTYRELYPNPATHPGLSWPFHKDDSWTDGDSYVTQCGRALDDRDRLDFIYYNAQASGVELVDASLIGPRVHTYFPGPHGEDDSYTWSDPHSGVKVDAEGEPQYGEREFVSDHLWYSTSFIVETPYDAPQSEPVIWEPQFENVELSAEGENLVIKFTLNNLDLMRDDWGYIFAIMGDRSGARDSIWQTEIIEGDINNQQFEIKVSNNVLSMLSSSEYDQALQLRLRRDATINGWRKDYALLTISKEQIEEYVNLAM